MKPNDVDHILSVLVKTTSWNPHGNFLIKNIGVEYNIVELRNHIISSFWKYFVININILPTDIRAGKSIITTWMPFNIANCTDRGLKPFNVNVFPQKFASRLNNCLIRASAVGSPPFVMSFNPNIDEGDILNDGLEITTLKMIAKKREFDLKIT